MDLGNGMLLFSVDAAAIDESPAIQAESLVMTKTPEPYQPPRAVCGSQPANPNIMSGFWASEMFSIEFTASDLKNPSSIPSLRVDLNNDGTLETFSVDKDEWGPQFSASGSPQSQDTDIWHDLYRAVGAKSEYMDNWLTDSEDNLRSNITFQMACFDWEQDGIMELIVMAHNGIDGVALVYAYHPNSLEEFEFIGVMDGIFLVGRKNAVDSCYKSANNVQETYLCQNGSIIKESISNQSSNMPAETSASYNAYPVQIDMDDMLSASLLGETFFQSCENGWWDEWMYLYVHGSSSPSYSYDSYWYDDANEEWTYYGINYARAAAAGWGDIWTQIMEYNDSL